MTGSSSAKPELTVAAGVIFKWRVTLLTRYIHTHSEIERGTWASHYYDGSDHLAALRKYTLRDILSIESNRSNRQESAQDARMFSVAMDGSHDGTDFWGAQVRSPFERAVTDDHELIRSQIRLRRTTSERKSSDESIASFGTGTKTDTALHFRAGTVGSISKVVLYRIETRLKLGDIMPQPP
jgi:hypothetical protein